jgi:hypothetical protein
LETNKETELRNYKTSLLYLRENNLDYTIGNKNAEHAAISSNVIFTGAKEEVKIYSGNLNSDVADNEEFVSGLISLISRDVKISLIMDSFDKNNISKGLRVLLTFVESKNNITIKYLEDDFLIKLKEKSLNNHFIIADNKMIRKETCPTSYKAKVNFKTTEADKFNNIFKLLNDYSKNIDIPNELQ